MVTQQATDLEKRIDQICDEKKLTHNKLAKVLDISSTTFYQLSSGRTKQLSVDVLIKFYQKLDINIGWLATGEGDMYASKKNVTDDIQSSLGTPKELAEIKQLFEEDIRAKNQLIDRLSRMLESAMGKRNSVSRRPDKTSKLGIGRGTSLFDHLGETVAVVN